MVSIKNMLTETILEFLMCFKYQESNYFIGSFSYRIHGPDEDMLWAS